MSTKFQAVGGAVFVLYNASTWEWWHYPVWVALIVAGFETFAFLIFEISGRMGFSQLIPRGKPLKELSIKDILFIYFNRCVTAMFTYHLIRYCWLSELISWKPETISLFNTLWPIPFYFVFYDFFYTGFHRVLHHKSIYHLIHKHHHRQTAPHRGNADAVNVHPFEFIVGEYTHLVSIMLYNLLVAEAHVASVAIFIVVGGVLASLNHTRHDIQMGWIYKVKYHDLHHWFPDANFCQYIILWDWVFGWYRAYPEKESDVRVKLD